MKVSVVVTTYNRRESLERCLASIAVQSFSRDEFELVVIADGCTDGSDELLRSHKPPQPFRWVSQLNQGTAAAQNAGIGMSRGDIVILLDDDCVCDANLVAAHYEAHRTGERFVAIGPVLLHPDSPANTLTRLKKVVGDGDLARVSSVGFRQGDLMLCANSSIARSAALECIFDPSYKRMHDVEAGLRLWKKGYRPVFCAEAVAYELFTKSVAGVLRDSKGQGKYEVILSQTHPEFKPLAGLVRINEGSPLTRWLRKEMAVHANISEIVLRGIFRVAERLRGLFVFSSIANRTLRLRLGTQHVRGAIDEAGSWKELESRFGRRTPVLLYHNVGSPRVNEYPGLTTPTADFEMHIRFLAKLGYQAILPSDWLRWRDEGASLPERPVMLVFDDGYEEASQIGFPILERLGFAAACMLVTSCIGSTNRWDEEAGRPSFRLMNEAQILHWSERNVEFGGHTSRHLDLESASQDRIETEILQCKEDLTRLMGRKPASFAYPFGGLSAAASHCVGRHFQLGFTSWPGSLHLATDPSLVPRIAFLPGESRLGIWCRLKLGKNPSEVLRSRWLKLVRILSLRVSAEKMKSTGR